MEWRSSVDYVDHDVNVSLKRVGVSGGGRHGETEQNIKNSALVRFDFHFLFGAISISLDPISICSGRFPFFRTDFHLFGSISISSDRFPLLRIDFH